MESLPILSTNCNFEAAILHFDEGLLEENIFILVKEMTYFLLVNNIPVDIVFRAL